MTTEAKPLTPAEIKLFNWAFDRLGDQLSCAGCNDFDLERDGGLAEWQEIADAINSRREPCDQIERVTAGSFMDFEIAGYLRDRINGRV